jgi:hypothetical protein
MIEPMRIPSKIATVLESVPEFAHRFLDLVEAADGDPGPAAVFTELAEFVASLLSEQTPSPNVLARCMAGVEKVARESEEAQTLIGWSFLGSLCPEDRRRLAPWFGPHTIASARDLEETETSDEPEEPD